MSSCRMKQAKEGEPVELSLVEGVEEMGQRISSLPYAGFSRLGPGTAWTGYFQSKSISLKLLNYFFFYIFTLFVCSIVLNK